jgi:hypothetical protein
MARAKEMVKAKISKKGTRINGASALDGEWRILKRADRGGDT